MHRPRILSMLAAACLLALMAAPAIALGAARTAKPTAPTSASSALAPLAQGPIDVQIWPAQDGQQTAVIVDVVLDSKQRLPARVRVPIPTGAVVEWAGEILGGDPGADPQRAFTIHSGAGGARYAEFTVSVSHRTQIDTSGIAMTARGTVWSTQVEYAQAVPATSTVFSVRIPAGASQVRIDPSPAGTPETNSAGELLYVLPSQTLPTGAKTTVKLSYNTSPGRAAQPGIDATTVYGILGALLVAAVGLVVYLARKDSARSEGDEPMSDDDEESWIADDQIADDEIAQDESPADAADSGDPFDDLE